MLRFFSLVSPHQAANMLWICICKGASMFMLWLEWCASFWRVALRILEDNRGR